MQRKGNCVITFLLSMLGCNSAYIAEYTKHQVELTSQAADFKVELEFS